MASVGITLPILLIGMTLQTGENTALAADSRFNEQTVN